MAVRATPLAPCSLTPSSLLSPLRLSRHCPHPGPQRPPCWHAPGARGPRPTRRCPRRRPRAPRWGGTCGLRGEGKGRVRGASGWLRERHLCGGTCGLRRRCHAPRPPTGCLPPCWRTRPPSAPLTAAVHEAIGHDAGQQLVAGGVGGCADEDAGLGLRAREGAGAGGRATRACAKGGRKPAGAKPLQRCAPAAASLPALPQQARPASLHTRATARPRPDSMADTRSHPQPNLSKPGRPPRTWCTPAPPPAPGRTAWSKRWRPPPPTRCRRPRHPAPEPAGVAGAPAAARWRR